MIWAYAKHSVSFWFHVDFENICCIGIFFELQSEHQSDLNAVPNLHDFVSYSSLCPYNESQWGPMLCEPQISSEYFLVCSMEERKYFRFGKFRVNYLFQPMLTLCFWM